MHLDFQTIMSQALLASSLFICQDKYCKGNHLPSQFKDPLSVPHLINLKMSGLQQSPQIAALNWVNHDGPAIVAIHFILQSQWITQPKPKLSFLSVFNSVGALWKFAPQYPHSTNEHLSFVAWISNDFEQINGLFDDTINDFCHHIMAFTTSNESSTYSQMLHNSNHKQFFEAMEIELDDHESWKHWTLMLHNDLPIGSKTIMAIRSFKQKQFPNGTLNKHKAYLCAHGEGVQ